MKIGIDFGTTYTKIAYVDGEDELKLFKYPDPTRGMEYTPTAIAYQEAVKGERIYLGRDAWAEQRNHPNVSFAESFKMLLPLKNSSEWKALGWSLDKSPAEVTRDYIRELLLTSRNSFKNTHGSIDSIVFSVPELWQRTSNNPGAETLRRVLVDELKLPVDHLRSEPVCAAAYCVYEYQRTEKGQNFRNLLICDMGGGTFDVALCRVDGHKIEVLDFDGEGREGFESAGVAFDRECVQTAYKVKPAKAPEKERFITLLREFESEKIRQIGVLEEMYELGQLDNPSLDDTALYTFERIYELTYGQVKTIFSPIQDGISQVLLRVLKRAKERSLTIDRVAIVGGFGQFPLVEKAILENLGITDPSDIRFDITLNREYRKFFAVSYGAALIANEIINPIEYYPHTLGISVFKTEGGIGKQSILPIVKAGQAESGREEPYMATKKNGEKIPVQVTNNASGYLPINLWLNGTGKPLSMNIPVSDYPEPGYYYIGVKIDRSNMGILVFESTGGKTKKEYRLGDINPKLIVEER